MLNIQCLGRMVTKAVLRSQSLKLWNLQTLRVSMKMFKIPKTNVLIIPGLSLDQPGTSWGRGRGRGAMQHSRATGGPSYVLGYSWTRDDCWDQGSDSNLSLPQCPRHHSLIHGESMSWRCGSERTLWGLVLRTHSWLCQLLTLHVLRLSKAVNYSTYLTGLQ